MSALRMPVYLDHAATTPLEPVVAARMAEVLSSESEFGNPASSSHGYGDVAAALVESARGAEEEPAARRRRGNRDRGWRTDQRRLREP